MKNVYIEKTYVVGTHWNYLYEAIPMCTYNICYIHLPSIMSIVFASF